MRAVRFAGVGRPAQIADVPRPSPGPGQILLKIGGAGVCHSDLHVMEEEFGFKAPFTSRTRKCRMGRRWPVTRESERQNAGLSICKAFAS